MLEKLLFDKTDDVQMNINRKMIDNRQMFLFIIVFMPQCVVFTLMKVFTSGNLIFDNNCMSIMHMHKIAHLDMGFITDVTVDFAL